jgi:hypothetical protein
MFTSKSKAFFLVFITYTGFLYSNPAVVSQLMSFSLDSYCWSWDWFWNSNLGKRQLWMVAQEVSELTDISISVQTRPARLFGCLDSSESTRARYNCWNIQSCQANNLINIGRQHASHPSFFLVVSFGWPCVRPINPAERSWNPGHQKKIKAISLLSSEEKKDNRILTTLVKLSRSLISGVVGWCWL